MAAWSLALLLLEIQNVGVMAATQKPIAASAFEGNDLGQRAYRFVSTDRELLAVTPHLKKLYV